MDTTSTDTSAADSSSESSEGSSSTGADVPDWGEGEPPDFGDLGDEGEGSVVVVHALDVADPVDVWLVGEATPMATALAPGDATRLTEIPRDARRVVFTRTGTQEPVGCSDWFPLRADEQWATVATRDAHDCSGGDGDTVTFEQALALSGNSVRFVHGARPDALTVERAGVPEGALEPADTLSGSDLPDCEAAGCTIPYAVSSAGIGAPRYFTFATVEVSDVPPAGELMFVVLGDVRQDWPAEPDSVAALVVDIEGAAREIRRDPEVAFAAPAAGSPVTFQIPTPPAVSDVATADQCFGEICELDTMRFGAGEQEFLAQGPGGSPSGTYQLEAGQRYVLTFTVDGTFTMLTDDFSRADETVSVGRVSNWNDLSLTVGRVFAGEGQPFDTFIDVPPDTVSEESELPADPWSLVFSVDGGPLGTGCFGFAETPLPWRGFVWVEGPSGVPGLLDLTAWPPSITELPIACA